jgi:hypothetical protein
VTIGGGEALGSDPVNLKEALPAHQRVGAVFDWVSNPDDIIRFPSQSFPQSCPTSPGKEKVQVQILSLTWRVSVGTWRVTAFT